jgi:outer membrane protein TolC
VLEVPLAREDHRRSRLVHHLECFLVDRPGIAEFRTDVADVARQSAEAQFADVLRRLKLDVTLACVDVLEAKVKLQLAQDNLHSLERLVELNERRLAGGAIPPLEVTRSKVAMLQYRGSVKTAELALVEARLKLLPLLGRQPDSAPFDIVEPLGTAPAAVKPDLAALQAAARASRPDLLALRREEARTQADLRLQSPDRPVRFRVQGDGGKLPAPTATPLAVVLTDLINRHDSGVIQLGGGLAISYDGLKSSDASSSDYGMKEYCADVVEAISAGSPPMRS